MFKHILVPLDGSSLAECVVPHVVAFASAFKSSVTLVQVLDQDALACGVPFIDPVNWQMARAESESYLEEVSERLHARGVEAECVVLEGSAADSVIEYAGHEDVDLIVLSSHGRSGLSGWNVSSVVQKILLRAFRSVLVVRAYQPTEPCLPGTERHHYRRVLVPLDGSQRAECALPIAVSLVAAHDTQLVLGHVVRWPEMPRRTCASEGDIELANRLVERNRSEVTRYLDELQAKLPVDAESVVLVGRDVALALHELVDGQGTDLVILSAHGYSGTSRWPYGSVATSLVSYGNTPILMIQDIHPGNMQPSQAELATEEQQGH